MKKAIVRGAIAMWLVCFIGFGTSCKKDLDTTALSINNPDFGGGKVLLYTTAGEYKGTVNVGNLPDMVASLATGAFDEGAAESLDYDPKGKKLFVINGEKKTADIIDVARPEEPKSVGSIVFSVHADSLQSVAVKTGLVAIAVE